MAAKMLGAKRDIPDMRMEFRGQNKILYRNLLKSARKMKIPLTTLCRTILSDWDAAWGKRPEVWQKGRNPHNLDLFVDGAKPEKAKRKAGKTRKIPE